MLIAVYGTDGKKADNVRGYMNVLKAYSKLPSNIVNQLMLDSAKFTDVVKFDAHVREFVQRHLGKQESQKSVKIIKKEVEELRQKQAEQQRIVNSKLKEQQAELAAAEAMQKEEEEKRLQQAVEDTKQGKVKSEYTNRMRLAAMLTKDIKINKGPTGPKGPWE